MATERGVMKWGVVVTPTTIDFSAGLDEENNDVVMAKIGSFMQRGPSWLPKIEQLA